MNILNDVIREMQINKIYFTPTRIRVRILLLSNNKYCQGTGEIISLKSCEMAVTKSPYIILFTGKCRTKKATKTENRTT